MAKKLDRTNVIRDGEEPGGLLRRHGRRHGHCGFGRHGGETSQSGEVSLPRVRAGSRRRIVRVHGDEAFRGKMMALGVVAGADITVVQGGGRAPIVLALEGSRLLLDARSAELVSVSPCETQEDKIGVRP